MTSPLSLDLLDTRLKPLCDAYLGSTQTPGASIALVVGDNGYHYGYGVKSILTREPVSVHTGFNIGSCTKALVSATLASLIADGLASWDDPVTKYVPEFQLYDPWVTQQVTLRDLSANRLGLPREGLVEYGFDGSVPVLYTLAALRHTQPKYPFRDRFGYVNTGHTANAVAAGRISGKGFLATLRERILAPLGMNHSSGGAAAKDELADQAAWHCAVDGKIVTIDTVHTDMYFGGGGMVVCGADAVQWLRLHLNAGQVDGKQIVPSDALMETHQPHAAARPGKDIASLFYPGAHIGAYCLGWAASDFEGHPMVCHSGGDFGISAMTILLPKSGIAIAVYCNRSGANAMATAYAIAATLLGMPARDWDAHFAALTPTPAAMERSDSPFDASVYAGLYRHPADGELLIERVGGELHGVFKSGYRMDFRLQSLGEHRFMLKFEQAEWRASEARNQSVLAFALDSGAATKAELQFAGFSARCFSRAKA